MVGGSCAADVNKASVYAVAPRLGRMSGSPLGRQGPTRSGLFPR